MIGYTCKYTPIELLNALGGECVLLNSAADDFQNADSMTHPNMCSHAKAIIEEYEKSGIDEIVFVNCCDSMRRVYDIIRAEYPDRFVFLMDLPHEDNSCAKEMLKNELLRLAEEYGSYKGTSFDMKKFIASFEKDDCGSGDFIGILGARVSSELLDFIRKSIHMNVRNLTCGENRKVCVPESSDNFEKVMEQYASALLEQTPCMRMHDVDGRRQLFLNPHMKGLVYHTVKFCDYYSFEYENIKKSISVPILKIESDYTLQSMGQLATRIAAFEESLTMKNRAPKITAQRAGTYVAGIDSGSTSTNMVILSGSGKICGSAIVRTGAKAENGAKNAFEKALAEAGISESDVKCVVATGYGRKNIAFADKTVTEISCHAKGVHHLNENVRTVIDIGGQDSKVICLDTGGNVKNFVMNDKCAAGTGRFLEMMARTLDMDIDTFSVTGMKWTKDLTISSICTVFAESEVVSLIAENHSAADIIHGLNKSVAAKTAALVKRAGGCPPFAMTGGVARNRGVADAISSILGEKLFVPENPDLCGALGAALFALE